MVLSQYGILLLFRFQKNPRKIDRKKPTEINPQGKNSRKKTHLTVKEIKKKSNLIKMNYILTQLNAQIKS